MDCLCVTKINIKHLSSGRINAKINISNNLRPRLSGVANIKTNVTKAILSKTRIQSSSGFKSKNLFTFGLFGLTAQDNSNIRGALDVSGVIRSRIHGSGNFVNTYVDKINTTNIKDYTVNNALEKLYPIQDIETSYNNVSFINQSLSTSGLYQSIDEGIITKNYDEKLTYIQPSSIFTEGSFKYKCKVSPSLIRPENSVLFIRASAPLFTYSSKLSPIYKIHNIKLEDSSGNLIIQYNDIIVRGDANYEEEKYKNFTTYTSRPVINYANQHTWKNNYPILGSGFSNDAYFLNLDFDIKCTDDPFNDQFDIGYVENSCELKSLEPKANDYLSLDGSPLSTRTQGYSLNPDNSIRITALEICNSGSRITLNENYLSFYHEVNKLGNRITRSIYPVQVLVNNYNTTIYPDENSTWTSFPSGNNNLSTNSANSLAALLKDTSNNNYITLDSTSSIPDSGKLKLLFSHEPPVYVSQNIGGAFSFGGLVDNNGINSAKWASIAEIDNFFTIDSIELKITAKKAAGSRNYCIDVVGYSDDKLLCSTPKIGGFLQNIEGSGYIPVSSGFKGIDDLGISSESLSDKYQFYSANTTNNAGGDHYLISTVPVVNSTEFTEYTVPLKIYEDSVDLGAPTDYSMSSYFEKLYLDIFPIPSGASISNIKLSITYKPSNALKLYTLANGYDELFRRTFNLDLVGDYTSSSGSLISNIPHSYKEDESTTKYNYSKRWRGVTGSVVAGPFDPNKFDFSYYNPELITPFLNGYYSFNYDSSNVIFNDYSYNRSRLSSLSGVVVGAYNKIKNIGLRFKSASLFSQSTPYTTIDWTAISGYENHELKNKITDSFNNAIRVSGSNSYINFGNVNCASGFAVFARFSPDISISGSSYNLWNSGTLFGKFDNGNNLEFALGYSNGKLTGYARNNTGTILSITDDKSYHEYNYPLCVMLSYNENNDNKLRLFTDTLKSTSSSFVLYSGNSNLTFGYSSGSGIGINAFISDIGISTNNILSSGSPALLNKEIIYDNFISGINNTLYSFIDDKVDEWHLGDFKICSFNQSFDRFITRIGSDFLIHNLRSSGSSYDQITDLTLPSSINTSNISYHSQIENDFLRFYLRDAIDANSAFYSIQPRISKDLPRGYSFEERAFVVETIIDHLTYDDIIWEDGKIGPKLIVSLYTKTKNPKYREDKINWGLINRHHHYLEPSGCYQKLSSIFSYEDLLNQDEPWAKFDIDRNLTEFEEKYYSTDINDMFLQYDLVYPSGSSFDSTIKFHSAQVKLENAITKKLSSNNSLNLIVDASGYQFDVLSLILPFRSVNNTYDYPSGLSLYLDANILGSSSGSLPLHSYSTYHYNNNIPLHTISYVSLSNEDEEFFGSTIYGSSPRRFSLYTVAESGSFAPLPLTVINRLEDQSAQEALQLMLYDRVKFTENLTLFTDGNIIISNIRNANMPLFVETAPILIDNRESLNLFIDTYEVVNIDSSMNLMVGNQVFVWSNNNVGRSIEIDDNSYSSLNANDEIRGVETMCYGDCVYGDPCIELEIKTHDVIWYPENCINGGIFRAKQTYTNLSASGFNTNIPYSGHFYGIRKFDNLIPYNPYIVEIAGSTEDGSRIDLPRILSEVEYGYNADANYSGVKLIADEPYCPSGRNMGDEYGKSVDVFDDVMAIGAPFHTLYDSGGYPINEAGAVFIYRRQPQPSGHTWSYHKGDWEFEHKLTLPSSILRDYYIDNFESITIDGKDYPTTRRQWYVGQEGRQFGHSLSLGKRGDKELLVVSGPSAKFTRTFEQLSPSGVNVGLFIFTDEFVPTIGSNTYENILQAIQYKDIIFKYFSDPPVNFDIKIAICEPTADSTISSLDFPDPKPSFIIKKVISRHRNDRLGTAEFSEIDNSIYSGIKDAFHNLFPYDTNKLNNNIPAILGFYVDDSRSLGERTIQPALDNFINYYQSYAFASGLSDFYDEPSSGVVIKNVGIEENWIQQSIVLLNNILDTGRLALNDEFKLFSAGIGPQYFNESLSEFNTVPNSGGAVYVFEKSDSWELKQTINSPSQLNNINPDRFGHTVTISKNGELIVIGSPYINDALMLYEYNDASNEYTNIYNYKYSDIPFVGTWKFLIEKYSPSSRLAYSVATNEDGSIVAAGAPTDSLDEFDDSNTYYSPGRPNLSVWPTYVNAGAVRLFESRKYFKHNKVVEYGLFGNLDSYYNSNNAPGLYNHMSGIFNNIGIQFQKTDFTDVDIPQDAGLLFINTPYIDAFSDEIKQNIIDWLSLGDRHLVLVGNDPVWEKDGAYQISNDIINKILSGLNSRMRLVPARNQYESIQSSGYANIVPATQPRKSMSTYLYYNTMYGSGAADIKVYSPGTYKSFGCYDEFSEINNKCAMPIKHMGDLRAQWEVSCQDGAGNPITYSVNWPLHFGSVTPKDYTCIDAEFQNITESPTKGYEPIPILAAAEFASAQNVIYPGVPERSGLIPTGFKSVYIDTTYKAAFGSPVDNSKAFEWSTDSGSIYNSVNFNINNTLSESKFYKPDTFNNKSALLQAKSSNKLLLGSENDVVSEKTHLVAEESYNNTSSKVILVAGTFLERSATLLSSLGDNNLNFYGNLISKNINGESVIAQLGDWTLNNDFIDADPLSIIKQKLEDVGNIVDINVSSDILNIGHFTNESLIPILPYDVCWIANPQTFPSNLELEKLKTWLSGENKKLVITYTNNISNLQIVKYLCDQLNLSMRPLYLTEKSRFADDFSDRPAGYNSDNACEIQRSCFYLNTNHIASIGFRPQDTITKLNNVVADSFVPISLGSATPVLYNNIPIVDIKIIDTGLWQLKTGVAQVNFDVNPGSGYKIFVDIVSEDISENQPLTLFIANGNILPNLDTSIAPEDIPLYDIDNETDTSISIKYAKISKIEKLFPSYYDGIKTTYSYNVQIPSGLNLLTLYFTGNNLRVNVDNANYTPKTTRLLAVSGCAINIDTVFSDNFINVPIYDWEVYPAIPETVVQLPASLREISTGSNKYCASSTCANKFDDKLIADGPVVVAQELEQVSEFMNGVNRSRITVISDSSLIQGKTIADSNGVIRENHRNFIQSLYPITIFPNNIGKRTFSTKTKIMSPERGSPQIYFSQIGNSGLNMRFLTGSSGTLLTSMKDHIDDYLNFNRALLPPEREDGDPTYLTKRPDPLKMPEEINSAYNLALLSFESQTAGYGGRSKFTQYINNTLYEDVGCLGGMPQIMKDIGKDFLDFDYFKNGYPGNLFGHSVALRGNTLFIGAPFVAYSGENIVSWSGVQSNSIPYNTPFGSLIGYNGGAGAVYVYEKTGNGITPYGKEADWSCTQKLRPKSINVGQDIDNIDLLGSGFYLGLNSYIGDDIGIDTKINDQFGYCIDVDGDTLAVGSPGHDFENYYEDIYQSGQFVRKEFNLGFDIPDRIVYDLGSSGLRNTLNGSGVAVLNNGAIYVFENRLMNFKERKQDWTLIEKIVPQGYKSRLQKTYVGSQNIPVSGSENDRFGSMVAINKNDRSDSDYTILAGVKNHKFATSGNHISNDILLNAGASYSYDLMLRNIGDVIANPNSWINARVFGEGSGQVILNFSNIQGPNKTYTSLGTIYSNKDGEIFLEVSGQDLNSYGFIRHRPYIDYVKGGIVVGTEKSSNLNIYISGQPYQSTENMNLFSNAADSANVYNNLGLYEFGIIDYVSGDPSSLRLYAHCPIPSSIPNNELNIYVSGIGTNTDNFSMAIRGK